MRFPTHKYNFFFENLPTESGATNGPEGGVSRKYFGSKTRLFTLLIIIRELISFSIHQPVGCHLSFALKLTQYCVCSSLLAFRNVIVDVKCMFIYSVVLVRARFPTWDRELDASIVPR